MIDVNGNKILNEDERRLEDSDFILSEIKFFYKGFIKSPDADKAGTIAWKIQEYLVADGGSEEIKDILEKLFDYSEQSDDIDFLSKLMVVLKSFSEEQGESDEEKEYAAEIRQKALILYDRICEINPSDYNLCVRVLDYTRTIDALKKISEERRPTDRISILLEKAEDFYGQIKETRTHIYYYTGQRLYITKYLFLISVRTSDRKLVADSIRKSIHCARNSYETERKISDLKFLARCYLSYISMASFSYAEEEDNLDVLAAWLEEADNGQDDDLTELLEKIRKRIRSFR
ncbi:MAG: hypothetical protein IKB88_04435 [Clostridia bacterium]|nr:hypothetical protein [Clostridia bacterium]